MPDVNIATIILHTDDERKHSTAVGMVVFRLLFAWARFLHSPSLHLVSFEGNTQRSLFFMMMKRSGAPVGSIQPRGRQEIFCSSTTEQRKPQRNRRQQFGLADTTVLNYLFACWLLTYLLALSYCNPARRVRARHNNKTPRLCDPPLYTQSQNSSRGAKATNDFCCAIQVLQIFFHILLLDISGPQ